MPEFLTVDDYRTAITQAVSARPECVWVLARLALGTAAQLVPHLQPHATLLSPQNAAVVAEYSAQCAHASSIPEVRIIAGWAGHAAACANTIHTGASSSVGEDGLGVAELAAGIIQQVEGQDELTSWAQVLAAAQAGNDTQGAEV